MLRWIACSVVATSLVALLFAQPAKSQQTAVGAEFVRFDALEQANPEPLADDRPPGCEPCSDCCCCPGLGGRDDLTGDFFGLRSHLAQRGVVVDIDATQFYQGVSSGGANEVFRYGGKMDYFFTFLGEPLGLWEGLVVQMHAETRFGEDVNQDAVVMSPVNVNMLYPDASHVTAITGLQITQALSEEWALTLGKVNALDFVNTLYPQTGRGIDGFMNTSIVLPIDLGRTVPLAFLGAGILKMKDQKIQGALVVIDSNNIPTTSGFSELFDNGATIVAGWRHFTDFGGRPGSHMLLGTYAAGDFSSLDPLDWAFIPGQGIVAAEVAGSWSATYILEQQLWADDCDPQRNVGLLGWVGVADRGNSPFETAFSLSVQAQGLHTARPRDRIGVGYFYSGLSGDFKNLLSALDVHDLQGGELYYNAELAPWFHLTADLQVVEPAVGGRDTATVVGLRAKIDF